MSSETIPTQGPADSRRAELASLRIHRTEDPAPRRRDGSSLGTQLFWFFSILLAAGAGYLAASQLPGRAAEIELVRAHSAASAAAGSLTATGYLQAKRRTSIGFKMSGRLTERLVDEGDKVKAGQVLARLDSREQAAAVARQQGALDQARAAAAEMEAGFRKEEIGKARWTLDQAKANQVKADQDLERLRGLFARKAAAKSQLEEDEAAARAARAAVETARQQLEMMTAGMRPEQIAAARANVKQQEALLDLAKTQFEECVLKAPFGGTILEKHVEQGSMLMFGGPPGGSSNAAEVFTLADLSELEAEIDIAEASLSQVHEGQPAEIVADAVPDKKYSGTLSKVMPRANRQKAVVPVKVRVASPDERLRPDMSVKVSFLEQKVEKQKGPPPLYIPRAAVRDKGGAKVVYLVRDGQVQLHVVELGKEQGAEIEVLRGLSPGDAMVANPSPDLAEGSKVHEKGQM
ncbi:MAG: efflux RND transporter periplasmic adaptor subunit [Candidatus Wallbacteria bacterium]|nr:efflux RND transporter periplasmic adaptor subunit [Candidatus Wallbacteria bacterium]